MKNQMMLFTFITLVLVWTSPIRAAEDIFAEVYTNPSAQVHGGMSLDRAQRELKRYRALRGSLGIADSGLPSRFGVYAKPLLGTLVGGAAAGAWAMAGADAIKQRGRAFEAMDERMPGRVLIGIDGKPLVVEPEKKIDTSHIDRAAEQAVPGMIVMGALGGYGMYRLIDLIADKIQQRRLHNRAQALIARWPEYDKEAPIAMKQIMTRLHTDLARSGSSSMPSPHPHRMSKLLGQTIARNEAALRAQIAAHKKAAKQRKAAR